jgi:hypothetical protein
MDVACWASKALEQLSPAGSPWQGITVLSPFLKTVLHSTAVFAYRPRNEHKKHLLDPAEFSFGISPSRLHNTLGLVVQLQLAIDGSQEGG